MKVYILWKRRSNNDPLFIGIFSSRDTIDMYLLKWHPEDNDYYSSIQTVDGRLD